MQDIVEDISEDGGRRTLILYRIYLDTWMSSSQVRCGILLRNSFAELFWRATPNKQIVELLRLRREYPLALLLVLKAEAPCSREACHSSSAGNNFTLTLILEVSDVPRRSLVIDMIQDVGRISFKSFIVTHTSSLTRCSLHSAQGSCAVIFNTERHLLDKRANQS